MSESMTNTKTKSPILFQIRTIHSAFGYQRNIYFYMTIILDSQMTKLIIL